jgi:hypothetical protein
MIGSFDLSITLKFERLTGPDAKYVAMLARKYEPREIRHYPLSRRDIGLLNLAVKFDGRDIDKDSRSARELRNEVNAWKSSRKIHHVKTWVPEFQAAWDGLKLFDIRVNDRNYQVGDTLVQQEWIPDSEYTGREIRAAVVYMVNGGEWGLPVELCVMGIEIDERIGQCR